MLNGASRLALTDLRRKRHIKCDETKPACRRCLKWKGRCEGYEGGDAAAPKLESGQRAAREGTGKSELTNPSDRTQAPPPLGRQSSHDVVRCYGAMFAAPDYNSAVFSNDAEKLYFDNWLSLAPSLGGGWFQSRLWCSTIAQLSTVEPAVRYAALAVGALAAAAFPLKGGAEARDIALGAPDPHYRTALTFFGRALRLVGTEQRPDEESRVRAAILACLLFVCFETLSDNRTAAMRHITHGLQILEQFLASRAPPAPADAAGTADPGASFNAVTTQSPSPYVLEDEVMQVFQRLDVQAASLGFWQPRRPGAGASSARAPSPAPDPHDVVPAVFADLEDARRWWDLVQRWLQEYPRQIRLQLERERARRHRTFDGATADALDLCDLPGARPLQARYRGYLEAWHAGFAPLYAAAATQRRAAGGEEPYLQAVSLRLQYLVQWIGVQTIWHSDYRMIYLLTPHFREVNRLADVLLPRLPEGRGLFTLDNGPCTALFFTSLKCRDASVREEGVRLLEKYPRKDGFWDTRVLAAIGKANRAIEAENETGEDFKMQ